MRGEGFDSLVEFLHGDTAQVLVVALWEMDAVIEATDLASARKAAAHARTVLEQALEHVQELVAVLRLAAPAD